MTSYVCMVLRVVMHGLLPRAFIVPGHNTPAKPRQHHVKSRLWPKFCKLFHPHPRVELTAQSHLVDGRVRRDDVLSRRQVVAIVIRSKKGCVCVIPVTAASPATTATSSGLV